MVKSINYLDYWTYDINDSNFNGSLLISQIGISAAMAESYFQKIRLKERVYMAMIGWLFPKDNKFYWIFNQRIVQLLEGGIIDRFKTFSFDPKRYATEYEPEVLMMYDLEAGFIVWLISFLFSILIFAGEWCARFKDYLVIKAVLDEFYKLASDNNFTNPQKSFDEEIQKLLKAKSDPKSDFIEEETDELLEEIVSLDMSLD